MNNKMHNIKEKITIKDLSVNNKDKISNKINVINLNSHNLNNETKVIKNKNIKNRIKINNFILNYLRRKIKFNFKTLYKININRFLLIYLIFLFFNLCTSKKINLYFDSEIKIILNGTGDHRILYSFANIKYTPDKIILNGELLNNTETILYDLANEINNVTMIWNNQLTSCYSMFMFLDTIIYIDLSKFDASKVTTTGYMFCGCTSLISINLNNFDTSSVSSMDKMFSDCISLKSLNLSNFDTSSVLLMGGMFYNCESLKYLDLSNFNTSSVLEMTSLFSNCKSLTSLNLSSFDTSSVTQISSMFKNSASLTSLNISNFNTSNVQNIYEMFSGCNSLISLDLNNFNTSSVLNMEEMFKGCSSLKTLYISNFDMSSVLSTREMFSGCSSLISLDLTNFNLPLDADSKDMFLYCNTNLIYCINETKNSDFSSMLSNFTNNCLDVCLTNSNKKFIISYNRCLDNCYDDNSYRFEYNKICYETCPYGTNTTLTNSFLCKNITNKCNIIDFFNNLCSMDNNKKANVNNIRTQLMNGTLDPLINNLIDGDKKDLLVIENSTIYQITSSDNQNNKQYYNLSTVKLGECENILKSKYNISDNETLLIFKYDTYLDGSLIPIINYEIFHPNTKEQLNLELCKDELINVNIPVSIDEDNLFKYDPNSDYYTDQCYPYTTDNGTDILLNDRYDEYNNNNMALCENNCTLEKYEEDTRKVTCECKIKINNLDISNYMDDLNLLYYNFTSNDLSSNMISMKCVYILFSKEGISKNIASYIFLFFTIVFVISGIIFYKCGYPLLEQTIQRIIISKQENVKDTVNHGNDLKKNKKSKKGKKKKVKKIKSKKSLNIHSIDNITLKHINKSNKSLFIKSDLTIYKDIGKLNKEKEKNEKIKSSLNENIELNNSSKFKEYELNTLLYIDALKYDKRNFLDIYISLIKKKHPLIFPFIKDYNSLTIKIDLILLSFSFQYFFNALFFNETTIHKIYEGEGNYNLTDLIPFIIYSFIFSHIFDIILKYLSLSERNINNIKKQESVIEAYNILDKEKKTLSIKYICFYCLSGIFFFFLWYYLSSFGAVYRNTQIHLVKNVLITFAFSLLYPFGINFLPSLLRYYSLKNSNREFFYKFSIIIYNI